MACITPYARNDKKTGQYICVPCGKCPECLKRRASGWSFRLLQEAKRSWNPMFVTLSFDNDHVPLSRNNYMTLDVKYLQLFFKRLRKQFDKNHPKIKYYAVGEYGSDTMRPHYHIILFNSTYTAVYNAWRFPPRDKPQEKASPVGNIVYGSVNGASCGYTLKYMSKFRVIPMHRNDDRVPEFSIMSKGLGSNYLTDQMIAYHKANLTERMYCTLLDGKKISMPRYYKDKMYTDRERNIIRWKLIEKNIELEEKKYRENVAKYGRDEYLRMETESRINSFKKMYKNAKENRNKI